MTARTRTYPVNPTYDYTSKPCQYCYGKQAKGSEHATWEDCQAALLAEDLRSPARRYRPRSSGLAATSWSR